MEFLHDGRPDGRPASATWRRRPPSTAIRTRRRLAPRSHTTTCSAHPRARWNVCSKEWIIRQYDHEVQGGTVIKPLVGVRDDGPGDAAVVLPVLGS